MKKNDETLDERQKAVLEWWKKLLDNPGGRAKLRQAKNLEEVFLVPEFHALRKRLEPVEWRSPERLALVAGALAHVKNNAPSPFAEQLASPGKSGSKAALSGLRFRRLLQHDSPEDLYGPIIRVIRLLDQTANIADLAKSLYWWNDRTKKEWAFAYYGKAPDEA